MWQRGEPLGSLLGDDATQASPVTSDAPVSPDIETRTRLDLDALVRRELSQASIAPESRVLSGTVVNELLKEAARIDSSLLVVGARGAGGALRHLLGSVSQQLTERPPRAVAIVPDQQVDMPAPESPWTMVVGVDGSAGSSRAVRWAASMAQPGSTGVVAVHALEPAVPDPSHEERASLAAEVQQRLDEEWCAPLRLRDVRHRTVLHEGAPLDVIRGVSTAESPACVVLGSRGLGALSQRLLGSVTYEVVHQSEITTVIVPAPRDCVTWQC